jgi:broad specificity phosphatase PhoE
VSRIALIRHAESSHVQTGWIDAAGFRAWREAYEAAGIREDARPPKELERLASAADLVVSSNSARAVATAQLLAPGREITVSPLLRELDLEGPRLAGLRLPLRAWSFAVGGRILHRTIRREYPSADETSRIVDAVAWLDELAREHGFVVAVTHAMFRRSLASHLVECGWHPEPGPRSMAHWSAWIFASAASAVNTSD